MLKKNTQTIFLLIFLLVTSSCQDFYYEMLNPKHLNDFVDDQDERLEEQSEKIKLAVIDSGIQVQKENHKKKIASQNVIHLNYASIKLSKIVKKSLNKNVIPYLKKNSEAKIRIEGYCDERGSIYFNKILGKKRAKEVKNYLVKSGISAKRITIVSYGESRPIDRHHTKKAWSKNRRVTIVAL